MRKPWNSVALALITANLLLLLAFFIWPWFGSGEGAGVAQWHRTILVLRLGALISIAALVFSILTTKPIRVWLVVLSLGMLVFWFTVSIPASDYLAVAHARSALHTSP